MHTPTTAWDRGPTDAELDRFYGKSKPNDVHNMIVETITETVRTVSHKSLSVPYVRYSGLHAPKVMPYPLVEVFTDYGIDKGPIDAFMEMVEKSDCPFVAAWRKAVAERFSDMHADEVEEIQA